MKKALVLVTILTALGTTACEPCDQAHGCGNPSPYYEETK